MLHLLGKDRTFMKEGYCRLYSFVTAQDAANLDAELGGIK